jgi:uncharacterized protein YbjT (DUF2867 family)
MNDAINGKKSILVTGATGKQGGAVVRHLLQTEFSVKALTRNPESAAAKRLLAEGVEIVVGNLDDLESLESCLKGTYGVFSVQNYWEKGVGWTGEIRQGKKLADAAKSAGVQHYVQSSMAKGQKFEGIKHFESKVAVEEHIARIKLPYTIIGTVYFMDNILDPKMGGSMTFPTLSGSISKETRFHLLSVDDLGGIVSAVFQNRDRFLNRRIDIASDCLTIAQMKDIYHKTSGRKPKSWKIPNWILRFLNREFAMQLKWQDRPGWTFEFDRLRQIYPKLTSFEQFLRQHQNADL